MDVRALHSPPRRLEIARKRRRAPRLCVRLLVLMPQSGPSLLTPTTCLPRHGINSPHEPEDLFLFAPNQDRENFVATYPIEPPKHEIFWFNWCTLCVSWATMCHTDPTSRFIIYYSCIYIYIFSFNIQRHVNNLLHTLCNSTAPIKAPTIYYRYRANSLYIRIR